MKNFVIGSVVVFALMNVFPRAAAADVVGSDGWIQTMRRSAETQALFRSLGALRSRDGYGVPAGYLEMAGRIQFAGGRNPFPGGEWPDLRILAADTHADNLERAPHLAGDGSFYTVLKPNCTYTVRWMHFFGGIEEWEEIRLAAAGGARRSVVLTYPPAGAASGKDSPASTASGISPRSDSGYVSPTTGSGYASPTTGSGYASPTTDGGYSSPTTGSGYASPTTGSGYASPTTESGYASPTTDGGYSSPTTGSGYASPTTGSGYASPTTGSGYASPTTDGGYSSPTTGSGYASPTAGSGYSSPTTGSGYAPPTTGSGYGSPTTGSGYSAPGSDDGYRSPTVGMRDTAPTTDGGRTSPPDETVEGTPGSDSGRDSLVTGPGYIPPGTFRVDPAPVHPPVTPPAPPVPAPDEPSDLRKHLIASWPESWYFVYYNPEEMTASRYHMGSGPLRLSEDGTWSWENQRGAWRLANVAEGDFIRWKFVEREPFLLSFDPSFAQVFSARQKLVLSDWHNGETADGPIVEDARRNVGSVWVVWRQNLVSLRGRTSSPVTVGMKFVK